MWQGPSFNGTKIALLCGTRIIAYRRDDRPGLPYAGLWDLPGGGREGCESPVACAVREVEEELGISLTEERVRSLRRFDSGVPGGLDSYFCVAQVTPSEVERIRFGDEGQSWRLMEASEFLDLDNAVPDMKHRLRDCLEPEA